MKIRYVGAKDDGEAAFERETGIVWFKGDEHDIADNKLAQRMLAHPDVFEAVETVSVGLVSAAPAGDQKPEQTGATGDGDQQPQGTEGLPPFTAEDLVELDDAQLKALAAARGLDVDGRKKGDKLRAALLEAQAKAAEA